MYGLDTNVLVRFLLCDDVVQAEQAREAIEQAVLAGTPVVLSLLTILETEWVLRSYAKLEKAKIISILRMLLETRDLNIELEEVLEIALYHYEGNNADFADCMMSARYCEYGCTGMFTFDKRASKLPRNLLLPLKPV